MSTRPAQPRLPAAAAAAANPRPAARRLDAVLRAGALGADTGGLQALAAAAMAGKILFDYLNMPDDTYGRTAWQRRQARWLASNGHGLTLVDQLNACINDGLMSIEAANAILDQLYNNGITSVQGYVAYAERTGSTNNHFYHKLKCSSDPDNCPPIPPPPLRPQYSDYGSPPPPRPQYSGYGSAPPLRPQSSAQDWRGRG